ncbi:MAG: MerR family transcriptional regulator [Sulfurovum sp.]|nr:MerR family transcriptional regulator [Sulfurovum sp.]
MALKMKELMLATGESKSTILYYVKEGLLPPPSKPKPNVHLYDEKAVEIIRLIKYLQQNFSYSIAQIKAIFAENNFQAEENFEMMVNALELISGGKEQQWYSREDFLEIAGLSEAQLQDYQERGLLFERAKGFGSKELEIADILKRAETLGLEGVLFNHYIEAAHRLAKEEFEAGAKLMRSDPDNQIQHYELFFDLILTLKPYLCNMHTVREYQNRYSNKEEEA